MVAWKIPFDDSAFILSLQKSIVDYYLVKAKFVNAQKVMGARAAVYKAAINHNAHSTNQTLSGIMIRVLIYRYPSCLKNREP